MIYYLSTFFSFFVWLFFNNFLFSFFVLCLAFISKIIFLHMFRNHYFRLKIQDLILRHKIITFMNVFFIIIAIIGIFIYWRIFKIGKAIDLKTIFLKIHMILISKSLIFLLILIIVLLLLILFLIQIILLLQKFVFYQTLKLHVYLITHNSNNDPNTLTAYERVIHFLIPLNFEIPTKVIKLILIGIYRLYIQINKSVFYKNFDKFSANFKIKINYYYHQMYMGRYLIILSIFYDIFFNDLIINKIYYILPITFLFYLKDKFLEIPAFIEDVECIDVFAYLTKKIKYKTQETIIFDDNTDALREYILDVNHKLVYAFARKNTYSNYIETYKYKKSLFIIILFLLYTILQNNIVLDFYLLSYVHDITLTTVLLFFLLIQIFMWILANYLRFFSYIYILSSLLIVSFLILIFIRHNIPLLFSEEYNFLFLKIKDTYTIEEKIIFIKEILKTTMSSDLLRIMEQLPFHDIISRNTTFADLREYVNNMIILYENYENILCSMRMEENNKIIEGLDVHSKSLKIESLQDFWCLVKNSLSKYYKKHNDKYDD